MTISPINFSRISHNMRTDLLSGSIQRGGRDLFLTQARLASGLRFVTPSEDPAGASRVLNLTSALEQQQQFSANVRHGDDLLSAADIAMSEISGLISEAQTIASQDVSNLTGADERLADAELIAAIRQELVTVGNRQFNGRYLFAGRDTLETPFQVIAGGVAYLGDSGDLVTRVPEGSSSPLNVPGNVLFGALSATIGGDVNLSPTLQASTRLEDLGGALGTGIRQGTLVFNQQGGPSPFTVSLLGAATIGDVIAQINQAAQEAGSPMTAELGTTGINIVPGSQAVTILDTGGGSVASALGMRTDKATSAAIMGQSLQPKVTRLTPVSALAGGTGVDVTGGLILTSGGSSISVDLSSADTVQDIINALNNSGANVRARINDSGTGLELVHLVSGTDLSVGENGGSTATSLGLRTLHSGTSLSRLNFGRGIGLTPNGDDLRINARDASTIDVNLDSARTVGDVIAAINDAAQSAGVNVTASLAEIGNGIRIEDASGGSGLLSVTSLGESTAAHDLGFVGPAADMSNELVGGDRGAVRPEGVLGALTDLEAALRSDDTRGISAAAERVDRAFEDMIRVHGMVGARSQAMRADLRHMEDASQTTEIFLSQVRDLDYAEAATQLQGLQTQMQAALQTGANLLSLSLLDFLG